MFFSWQFDTYLTFSNNHAIGLYLQMGVEQRSAGRWQMILDDGHENEPGIMGTDTKQIIPAIQKTVDIGLQACRADFNEMLVVKETDRGISAVREEVGEKDRITPDHASLWIQISLNSWGLSS